jgi:hypothetical protein
MRGSVLKMCRGPDLLGQHQVERGSIKPRQQAKARSRNLRSWRVTSLGTRVATADLRGHRSYYRQHGHRAFQCPGGHQGPGQVIKIRDGTEVAARYFVYKLYEATDRQPMQ